MPVMHSIELWTEAWTAALPLWLAAVRRTGGNPMTVAAAQSATAVLCLLAGRAGRNAGAREAAVGPWWTPAGAALLLLALNTLFSLDLLLVELLRGVARGAGWYEARRSLQVAALLVLAGAGLLAWARWARWAALRVRPTPGQHALFTGLALLAGVAALRAVSLHATDEWLATRLAGLSLGRGLEALGLGLAAFAAVRALRAVRS